MRDWSQESFPLSQALVREIFRDAAAVIGKAARDEAPATFCQRTVGNLNFDRPPVPDRPQLERRTMFGNVQSILRQTGTWVSKTHFSESGWLTASSRTKIETFAQTVLTKQRQL